MTHSLAIARRQRGFTLMEMAVVLVIIALILGGVSVGRDVYRAAQAERISSQFIQGWMLAYDTYVLRQGIVPGDNAANPSGKVMGGTKDLCDKDLRDAMLAAGVSLPSGRAEGLETHALYQDANGSPQDIEVCFLSLSDWAEPAPGNNYALRSRNVMRLNGLTPEMARQLDNRIDGQINADHGRVREATRHNRTANLIIGQERPWSADELTGRNIRHDDSVALLTAYVRMNQ